MKQQEKTGSHSSMMTLTDIIAGLRAFAPYDNPQIAVCVILEGG